MSKPPTSPVWPPFCGPPAAAGDDLEPDDQTRPSPLWPPFCGPPPQLKKPKKPAAIGPPPWGKPSKRRRS